jgi:folate-binding protein YgfZ
VLLVSTPGPVDLHTTLGAVARRLDVVDATGPDALGYLQGQLSQELEGLAVGAVVPSLLLQPTGKLTAWLRVVRRAEDGFALVVDAGAGDEVLGRLSRFKLRTAIDLTLTTRTVLAVRGPGAHAVVAPAGTLAVASGWPGVEGVDLVADSAELDASALVPEGVELVDPAALEALRIECGVPAMGAELTEATIPAEGGQWLIDASVSFTKGCYTGQELVARIDSRGGNVPRPVRGLVIDGDGDDAVDLIGGSLVAGEAEVGHLTSAARSATLGLIGLAPLARTVEVGSVLALQTHRDERTATVRELPLR